jgi:hypothetical protein
MRALYIVLGLGILTLAACKREAKPDNNATSAKDPLAHLDSMPKDGVNMPVKVDTMKNGRLQRRKIVPEFNAMSFVRAVDTVVGGNAGKRPRLRFQITSNIKDDHTYFAPLHPSSASEVRYFTFKGKLPSFWLLKVKYNNEAAATSALASLRQSYQSKKETKSLTYTNDYVIQMGNQLMWLNMPCSYAPANVTKIKRKLVQNLRSPDITDSITCRCGGMCNPK